MIRRKYGACAGNASPVSRVLRHWFRSANKSNASWARKRRKICALVCALLFNAAKQWTGRAGAAAPRNTPETPSFLNDRRYLTDRKGKQLPLIWAGARGECGQIAYCSAHFQTFFALLDRNAWLCMKMPTGGQRKSVGHGGGRIKRIEDAGDVGTLHNMRPYSHSRQGLRPSARAACRLLPLGAAPMRVV